MTSTSNMIPVYAPSAVPLSQNMAFAQVMAQYDVKIPQQPPKLSIKRSVSASIDGEDDEDTRKRKQVKNACGLYFVLSTHIFDFILF